MSITEKLVQKRSAKHVLVLSSMATLSEMAAKLVQSDYPEEGTYVVTSDPAGGYRVTLAAKLVEPVKLTGRAAFNLPLGRLPIPPATEVIRQDTSEAGGKVEARLRNTPGATFVIVDDTGFVALFANPNLAGGALDELSLLGLHGEHVKLGTAVKPLPSVQPPTCPHCHKQGWYRFENGRYLCQACKQTVATA